MDHARTMRDAGQRGNGPAGREIRSRQRFARRAKSDPDNVLPGAKREIVVWIGF
jgi:hypothetical protein